MSIFRNTNGKFAICDKKVYFGNTKFKQEKYNEKSFIGICL